MAQLNFDASTVEPSGVLEAVPPNWYNAMITHSEAKPTKNGKGSYLELGLKIVDGEFAGRMIFDRLNLQNENQKAVEIAYQQLSAYCHATGVIQVQDSDQLHGIPFMVKVGIEEDSTGQYEPQNRVKQAKPLEGASQPMSQKAPAQSQPSFAPSPQSAPPAGQPSFGGQAAPAQTTDAPATAPKPPWA